MAVQKQIWRPDTCACVIEETHDPANSAYGVQFSAVISKCVPHAAVTDANLWGVIYSNPDGENKRKNLLHKMLLETSSLNLSATDPISGTLQWKPGITFSWAYNANRQLEVTIVGFTPTTAQRNTFNNYCTNTFGANKVILL